jgi:hypothetical protein
VDELSFSLTKGPLTLLFCPENKLQVIFASHTAFDLQESNFLFGGAANELSISGGSNNRQKSKNSKGFKLEQIGIILAVFVFVLFICCLLPAYRRNSQNNELEKKDENMFVFREEEDDDDDDDKEESERVTQIKPADWQAEENDLMDEDDEKVEDKALRPPLQSHDSSSLSLSQNSSSNFSSRSIQLIRKNSKDDNTAGHNISVISSSLSSYEAAESVTEIKPPSLSHEKAIETTQLPVNSNSVEFSAVSDSSSSTSFNVSADTEELEPELWVEDSSDDDEDDDDDDDLDSIISSEEEQN